MCNHETEYLMGVAGGVICRKCGMRFDHIPKQAPEPKAEKAPTVKAEAEEKPKKTTRKTAAKKGAK